MPSPLLRQHVAVLYSEATRRAYIKEARQCGELYPFVDAQGKRREWLKGE
jgi:hypothetical protein